MTNSSTRVFLAVALLSLAGCATGPRTTMLTAAHPAIPAENVRVYPQPPRHFEEIAIVQGHSVDELRAHAAAVGANGLIPRGMVHNPGPEIGIGIGGGGYSWGRHGGVGVESGAAFGIPTGNDLLQASAILVR